MGGPAIKDIKGLKFNRITVISFSGVRNNASSWNCRCDCGKEFVVAGAALKSGNTKSCGCFKRDVTVLRNKTHGLSGHPLQQTWIDMHHRCKNPKFSGWNNYGGRGIKVCDRWESFSLFIEDMGEKPKGMSIERNDVNGNYEPGNCRWATNIEQANNTTKSRFLVFNGHKLTVAQWARKLKVNYDLLSGRIKMGWPVERILTISK